MTRGILVNAGEDITGTIKDGVLTFEPQHVHVCHTVWVDQIEIHTVVFKTAAAAARWCAQQTQQNERIKDGRFVRAEFTRCEIADDI